MSENIRLLLVPGAGGSGADHWDRHWEAEDARIERAVQADWNAGTCAQWVKTLDYYVQKSDVPTLLIAHSLGNMAVCHWAAVHTGSVIGALLVAPTDINDDWVEPGSLYEQFRPLPMKTLPFPSVLVASTNDQYLSLERAKEFATTWGASLRNVGPIGHIGSDSKLGNWFEGRGFLDQLIQSVT